MGFLRLEGSNDVFDFLCWCVFKVYVRKGSMWLMQYVAITDVLSVMVFLIGFDVLNNIFAYCQEVVVKGLRGIIIVGYIF